MKRLKILPVGAALMLALMTTTANAQDEIFRNGVQLGIGARAIAMGGAFGAVGDDYSASFWNPAALAQVRRLEFAGALNHLSRENLASFSNASFADEFTQTRLNEIGFAYPVPTYRGSLVFSFGYNQAKTLDANFSFGEIFNDLPQDSVSQAWRERETGRLGAYTVAGAIDLSPNLSAGIGLNFWYGRDEYLFTERERDIEDIYTFNDFRRDDQIDSQIRGFNATLGALLRVNPMLKLGATIATPITYRITEEWSTRERTTFDDGDAEIFDDDGVYEYKIRSPYTFSGSASLNLPLLVIAGQVEYNDWTRISYRTDPPIAGLTREEANEAIEEDYRATTRIRLGAELTLPGTATQIRAGYFRDPAQFSFSTDEDDREFYSLGLGFLLDKQIKLDLTYVHGQWTEKNAGLNDFVTALDEKITFNKLFATVSVRF